MIITRTPFRLTLGGGGTDLPAYYSDHGGFILAVTIDKYMYININTPILDNFIRIKYSQNELCRTLEEVQHTLAREALNWMGIQEGIEIISIADIPAGTGLGSSSCYLVGLLNGLHALLGEPVGPRQLAEEACEIELDVLKKPIGKQDQYMAAFGGLTTLEISPDGTVFVQPVPVSWETLEALEDRILLFYTGLARDTLQILGEQSAQAKSNDSVVVGSLHQIKDIGLEIKQAIMRGDLRRFGELLDVHWQSKKRLSSRISNSKIDEWYELAKAHGAIGGKISGAGGGGFLLVYCEGNKQHLREAMQKAGLVELRFRFDLEGSRIVFNVMPGEKRWVRPARVERVLRNSQARIFVNP
jgi:D-glycero-alpha-D-manno-heptose-7-phosphate kinase